MSIIVPIPPCRAHVGGIVKNAALACAAALSLTSCAIFMPYEPPPVQWGQFDEAEYAPYAKAGNAVLSGQAFLMTRGGEAKKAAGRQVTLDPATTLSQQWWAERRMWSEGGYPPDPRFLQARRATVADADGRFRFENLPAGTYFVRTLVRWEAPCFYCLGRTETQGGLLGEKIELRAGEKQEIVLSHELYYQR
jgi:hypothetical protein